MRRAVAAGVAAVAFAACGGGTVHLRTTAASSRPYVDAPDPTSTTAVTTTSTTEAVTTTTSTPRSTGSTVSRGSGRGQTVTSTAYCETGTTASGAPTRVGTVAANAWPLGTVLEVSDSPYGPGRFTVTDRIGWGSELDFSTPGDCGLAVQWGRRTVTVEVVG